MSDYVIQEYEVFKNERDALAFFFHRQANLDDNDVNGPFWFAIDGKRILAGTDDNHAVFENLEKDILETARRRGVLMLVEFEDQQPYRCTPCYLAASA